TLLKKSIAMADKLQEPDVVVVNAQEIVWKHHEEFSRIVGEFPIAKMFLQSLASSLQSPASML
ncbi:MAG: hypothetical protein ABW185_26555, partial [Sedimenticola sp.]